jgi:hypothetical protein
MPMADAPQGVAMRHSFVPYVSPEHDDKLRITTGCVNTLEVEGADDVAEFSIPSGYRVFWVHVSVDGDGVAESVEIGSGGSVPGDTDTDAYQPVFEVNAGAVPSAMFVRSSLRHQMCNGQHQFGGLG